MVIAWSADSRKLSSLMTASNLPPDNEVTATYSRQPFPAPGSTARPTGAPDRDAGEELKPGDLIAGRYRIVSKLGAGGMGEVYRADDLTLAAPVALKFLPSMLSTHPGRLDRFRGEVRVSRQVSHPNVVRVFDITEDAGRVFLSMEYIDGEDLASLLRRIGRLPHDKAIELARQICFGLHAAHDKGLIHRDLKPANIMIDGRGNARVTDFGISGIAEDLHAKGDIQAGTPAYMAPEQLDGTDISKRSDLYSLGLVLYELFTGRPAYNAESLAQLRSLRQSSTRPTSPSSFVKDIDPAVERVILHCLEPHADDRPTSAIAVAAALPGGDPLAAALAAGELPSPELVAAAGPARGMKLSWAGATLVGVIVAIALTWIIGPWAITNTIRPFNDSPDVMRARARTVLKQLGHDTANESWASGYGVRGSFRRSLRDLKFTPDQKGLSTPSDQMELLRKGPLSLTWFWYASSPYPIRPDSLELNYVSSLESIEARAYASTIQLDPSGKLLGFSIAQPRLRVAPLPTPVDWAPIFELAGFDIRQFTPAEPAVAPGAPADAVFAWVQNPSLVQPGPLGLARIDASSFGNRPADFQINWPYNLKPPEQLPSSPWYNQAASILLSVMLGGAAIGVFCLAIYQVREQRADVRSAFRLAIVVLILQWLGGVFSAERFAAIFDKSVVINRLVPGALYAAAFIWVYYLALEPVVRRARPQLLTTWSRVFAGRWNDPVVGRDVLIGTLGGSFLQFTALASKAVDGQIIGPTSLGYTVIEPFRTFGGCIAHLAEAFQSCVVLALFVSIFYAVALLVLRRGWLAAIATFAVCMLFPLQSTETMAANVIVGFGVAGVIFVVARYGVLASVAVVYTFGILDQPYTTDVSNWLFPNLFASVLAVLAIAAYGLFFTLRQSPYRA